MIPVGYIYVAVVEDARFVIHCDQGDNLPVQQQSNKWVEDRLEDWSEESGVDISDVQYVECHQLTTPCTIFKVDVPTRSFGLKKVTSK